MQNTSTIGVFACKSKGLLKIDLKLQFQVQQLKRHQCCPSHSSAQSSTRMKNSRDSSEQLMLFKVLCKS